VNSLPRIPPGQVVAQRFPVLHEGRVPPGPEPWRLRLFGAVEAPTVLGLAELRALHPVTAPADVHCITGWSWLGSAWTGVPFDRIEALARPRPEARFLMAHAAGGWTTNLALDDCRRPGVAAVWACDGLPLSPEHGGPLRLLVPHLYFWKSCKWLVALEWMERDRPGFWERNTRYGELDPWHACR
jgi:DMSO/TMAO reductase YedYZ molybdopterin-dependent catalytic subunit